MSHAMIAAALMAFLLLAFSGSTPAAAQQLDATAAAPEFLKWNPAPFPGITIAVAAGNPTASGMYAIFVKFAPGAKALVHTHPDQRIVTVLSGTAACS
jgi:quercetin dioxygenase-like cupin family protein